MHTGTVFCLALSIVLIILGSIIVGSVNKSNPSTKDTNIKNSGMGVLVIGLIFFLYGAYYIYQEHGHHLSKIIGGSSAAPQTMYFF